MSSREWEQLRRAIVDLTPEQKRILRADLDGPPADSNGHDESTAAAQHRALMQFIDELASLPLQNPQAAWSGVDHDRVLYGEPPA